METFDPWDSSHRADPHVFWDYWRHRGPFASGVGPVTGRTFHFVLGHSEVISILRNPSIGKEPARHLPPELIDENMVAEGPFAALNRNMLFVDPPDHTRLRRLARDGFSKAAIDRLVPRIGQLTSGLLDRLEELDEFDLIADFALPLPVTVIAEMLGIPESDRELFRRWSQAVLGRVDTEEEMIAAAMEFVSYLNELADARRAEPTDDLTSHLLHAVEDGESLTHEEFLGTIFLLLVAGHETTVNLIGNGILELMCHPDEYTRLLDDRGLVPSAIEEMLRYHGPVETATLRFSYEDQQIGDRRVEAGDLVIAVLAAANRTRVCSTTRPDSMSVGTPEVTWRSGQGSTCVWVRRWRARRVWPRSAVCSSGSEGWS